MAVAHPIQMGVIDLDARFGSFSEVGSHIREVRSASRSSHHPSTPARLKGANERLMYRSKQLRAVQARFAGSGVERVLGARHRPFVGNPNNARKRSKPNSGSLWHVLVWRWDYTEVLYIPP
jgi:hypothetical protein